MLSPEYEVSQLLRSWSQGDETALERLIPLVYEELHRLAQRFMADERRGHTLQPTALVNEAFLRLVNAGPAGFQDRTHFFAISARVMRRILVDWARLRRAQKRGSDMPLLEVRENLVVAGDVRPWGASGNDLIAIDDALKTLEEMDARKSQIVELRFFGGLSIKETADVLKVSEETIRKDWNITKSWLKRELVRGELSEG